MCSSPEATGERDTEVSTVGYAVDSRFPSNNGNTLQTIRMCEGFTRSGVDVTLAYPNRVQTNPELIGTDIFDYYGVSDQFDLRAVPCVDPERIPPLADGRFRRPFEWIGSLWFAVVSTLLYRLRPRDVHVTRNWLVAVAFVLAGLPTIFEIHKTEGLSFSSRGRKAISSVSGRDAFRAAVTLTDPTADGLSRIGIPPEKIVVEPDAVDLSAYEMSNDQDEARERLGLSKDTTLVGYTGSLFQGKGAHQLVDACRDLDVTVLIVGGTESDRESFETYLDDRGIDNVRLVGRVPPTAVPDYQVACDVLVLPPTTEGSDRKHHPESTSPLKLFEYMAAGKPIVATRLPGIEDVLTDEKNGLLVEPGDPDALRGGIVRVLDDEGLADSLGEAAESSVEQYTWSMRARRIAASVSTRTFS